MKQFITLSAITLFTLSSQAFASESSETALKMIPGGKVIQEKTREVMVLTPNQSTIEVEFKRNGKVRRSFR